VLAGVHCCIVCLGHLSLFILSGAVGLCYVAIADCSSLLADVLLLRTYLQWLTSYPAAMQTMFATQAPPGWWHVEWLSGVCSVMLFPLVLPLELVVMML
jgi:hypothetical protein